MAKKFNRDRALSSVEQFLGLVGDLLKKVVENKQHFSWEIQAGERALPSVKGANGKRWSCGALNGEYKLLLKIAPEKKQKRSSHDDSSSGAQAGH